VKLKLHVPGNTTPIAKRIPATNLNFASLIKKATQLAEKHNMHDGKAPVITYKDSEDWSNVEIEDDDDLELALAKAISTNPPAITFFIKTSKSSCAEPSQAAVDQ
jgi:hypothetical protein